MNDHDKTHVCILIPTNVDILIMFICTYIHPHQCGYSHNVYM